MSCVLYLVIPCYNEEEVLPETSKQLLEKINSLVQKQKISEKSRIVFVNDGSKDRTWELIENLHAQNPVFQGVKLSRNRGHQNALLAGLMTVKNYCDAAISLDADLQDDINAIDEMVDKFTLENCDIVYGVRSARKTDTFFKKTTAEGFYKVMNRLGAEVTYNHADYRLMSRRALDGLEQFGEVNLFLRGIVPMIGYKSDCVYYERKERFAGESKYQHKKMLAFAMEGITSLSTKPIKMITGLGALIFCISFIVFICLLISRIAGATVNFTTVSVWLTGGLQLIAIGIVGEYVGKVYLETKHRPKFIIEKYLDDNDKK